MKLLPVMSPIYTHSLLTVFCRNNKTQPSLYREPFTVIMSSLLLFSIQILVHFPTELSPISLSQMLLSKLIFLNSFRFNHSTVSLCFICHTITGQKGWLALTKTATEAKRNKDELVICIEHLPNFRPQNSNSEGRETHKDRELHDSQITFGCLCFQR